MSIPRSENAKKKKKKKNKHEEKNDYVAMFPAFSRVQLQSGPGILQLHLIYIIALFQKTFNIADYW